MAHCWRLGGLSFDLGPCALCTSRPRPSALGGLARTSRDKGAATRPPPGGRSRSKCSSVTDSARVAAAGRARWRTTWAVCDHGIPAARCSERPRLVPSLPRGGSRRAAKAHLDPPLPGYYTESSTAWISASFERRTRQNSGTSVGRPKEISWKSAFQRSGLSPLAGSTPKRIRYFRPPIRVSTPTLGSTRHHFELESAAPALRVSPFSPPVLASRRRGVPAFWGARADPYVPHMSFDLGAGDIRERFSGARLPSGSPGEKPNSRLKKRAGISESKAGTIHTSASGPLSPGPTAERHLTPPAYFLRKQRLLCPWWNPHPALAAPFARRCSLLLGAPKSRQAWREPAPIFP